MDIIAGYVVGCGRNIPFFLHLLLSDSLHILLSVTVSRRGSWLGREGAVSLNKGIPELFFPTHLDLRNLASEHSPWNQKHAEIQRKGRTPFGCQAHLHRGTGDLLSVKCQYRCNKDGTLEVISTFQVRNHFQ